MNPLSITRYFDFLTQSQKIYSRYLEPVCKKWELTRSEIDVLLFLYNNPQYDRAADIVSHRGMAKSHVSLSVANLTELGLLKRHFSPVDRRNAHLSLTQRAIPIAEEARHAQIQFADLLYQGISQEELQIWNGIIQRVYENISTYTKEHP